MLCIISSNLISKFFSDSVHEKFALRPLSSVISSSLFKFSYNLIFWELHLFLESSVFFTMFIQSLMVSVSLACMCFQHEMDKKNSRSSPLSAALLQTEQQVYHLWIFSSCQWSLCHLFWYFVLGQLYHQVFLGSIIFTVH